MEKMGGGLEALNCNCIRRLYNKATDTAVEMNGRNESELILYIGFYHSDIFIIYFIYYKKLSIVTKKDGHINKTDWRRDNDAKRTRKSGIAF